MAKSSRLNVSGRDRGPLVVVARTLPGGPRDRATGMRGIVIATVLVIGAGSAWAGSEGE